MTHKIKTVAVYCGHTFGLNPEFAGDATLMGELIAKNGLSMVFGGGDVGLMGAVSSAALDNGAHVTGISTEHVVALQEPVHQGINVEIVGGVNERKQKMFELSDAFIILPGGIGTLNEVTDILTMQQIGETTKPIFFLNTCRFWGPLHDLIIDMLNNKFVETLDDYRVIISGTPNELIDAVLNYKG
ncbi:MAG: TIGR00730 family Rossman fold protein [Alphaproteobacteria bacterium]|nr:TIGR00730 family Rossman fold protein [Alphaproteobacteria bacterium]